MSTRACNTTDNVACSRNATVVYAINNVGCLILCITNDTAECIITAYGNVACKILKHSAACRISNDTANGGTAGYLTVNTEVLKPTGLNSTEE